jgi:glycosyltransferase involved in cell wall biosynthesis
MIDSISLAIPFYNTSKYFLDCIRYCIDDDFVSEIVVNDDQSTEEEWDSINNIIFELNSSKIKLYRNPINLGGFKNKYKTVKKATSNWIYLLDSDNYLDSTTLQVIKNIENPDVDTCYCPEMLVMIRDNGNIDREVTYSFPYEKIGMRESKEAMNSRMTDFGMFLNTGNYIFNRDMYLNRILDAYIRGEDVSAADCIAFQYNWIKNGGYSKVVSGFKYYHRLRSDSYWESSGHSASSKASYYEALFCNINV